MSDETQTPDPGTLSEAEMERFLFDETDAPDKPLWSNIPLIAGLLLILVGAVYILQQMGLWQGDISDNFINVLVAMLPYIGGILIILIGFGVLSSRPRRKNKKPASASRSRSGKKILTRSRNKKIFGVAGGIAEYFNIDATLVRIAFVILLIASGGAPVIIVYPLLAFVLPRPDKAAG